MVMIIQAGLALKKILSYLLCMLILFFHMGPCRVAQADTSTKVKTEELNLHAKAAALIDGDNGRVLYGNKNAAKQMAMASTTKIMTCIIVLEQGDLQAFANVSAKAQSMPKVHLTVRQGEEYRVEDLLYSLMLESHNDSAVVLAECIGGSVEGFAALMNEKAGQLGCRDTQFVTPNGLDADGHYTTAVDLAKIMRYCVWQSEKREKFLEITRTQSHTFTNYKDGKPDTRTFTVSNKNAFLSMMDGVLSGKTGFTSKAGYCYVCALEKDGMRLVVAVLACGWPSNKGWKWEDTRKLMQYGLENFRKKEYPVIPEVPPITVLGGKNTQKSKDAGQHLYILAKGKAKLPVMVKEKAKEPGTMLLKETEQLTVEINLPATLTAPVKKGSVVGMVSYYLDGVLWETFPVEAADGVEKQDFGWIFRNLCEIFFFI